MAILQVSNEVLESLEKLAESEGLEVNSLAEDVLSQYINEKMTEEEPSLELSELLTSIAKNEAEKAAGISVSEEEIDHAVAELINKH